ncbi:N-acetyltransferase [Peribacillus asahii]|uniref:Acetyltransferase n=1 Tax=Peribacillus asahii TaxID=228899 RepID=A0A3T0KLL2_9BACI|nr:N-acetyltransferase [Peribacillus asahii]AZV41203.1 acetyltransferase [Peribacillus asahii]USK85576.1 N-acetyltransferase [Peribacillus asahii]
MVNIRKAKASDVEAIYSLINMYAQQGLLLPRTRESLYENLQAICVATIDDQVVGAASLHILGKDLSEIRSLVVAEEAKGRGIGKLLVEQIVEETRKIEIKKLISLTYQVTFFEKCGFQVIQKDEMPQKVWKDCLNCSKFPTCDEIAMAIYL